MHNSAIIRLFNYPIGSYEIAVSVSVAALLPRRRREGAMHLLGRSILMFVSLSTVFVLTQSANADSGPL